VNRDPLVELPPELLARPVPSSPGAGERAGAGAAGGHARFVLGIDGGATKTLAAVLDLERHTLHLGHGGPSNEDAVGTVAAVRALLEAADAALARAGGGERPDAAVLALAGTDTEAVARHVRRARSEEWIVVNDVVAAWAAATGARPGIGVISGTGSNVFGVGVGVGVGGGGGGSGGGGGGGGGGGTHGPEGWVGRAWRAGGWGQLLGDEGSGYWLGSESLKAALRDRDGSGPETALSEAAVAFFEVASVEAVAARVYSEPLSKGEIAAFATETARLAGVGDAVARSLYERGAGLLGEQIAAVIRHTGLAGDFPVGLIGSAFKAGAVFVEPLRAAVRELAPAARVSVVEMAPVGGSLLLGMRACGREGAVDARELARLLGAALAA